MSSYEMKCLHMTALLLVTEYSQIFKFLVANRSVPARFKDSKQISETVNFLPAMIAITICTNQFHLRENGCESLKLVWYRTRIPVRKNRIPFSDILLLLEIFHWNDPNSRVQFTFLPDFPETFWYLICELVVVNIRFISSFQYP